MIKMEVRIYYKNKDEVIVVPLDQYEISLKDNYVTIFNDNELLSYKQKVFEKIVIYQKFDDDFILGQTIWKDGKWITSEEELATEFYKMNN